MKLLIIGLIVCVLMTIGIMKIRYKKGFEDGAASVRNSLPSCLYINRPKENDIKPWGCDGKEGIDVVPDKIHGGGLYISLHKWKKN